MVAAAVAPAAAEPGNIAARQLFEAGRSLIAQNKRGEACELFERSARLDRAAGTVLNLADCAEQAGQLEQADALYAEAALEFTRAGSEPRARFARERQQALRARMATLVIRLAEPAFVNLSVIVDGRPLTAAAEIVTHRAPGEHRIVVGAPGFQAVSRAVRGGAGERVVIEVPALRSLAAPASTIGDDRPLPPAIRRRSRVYLAAGLAGGGVLALGTSVVVGLVARGRANDAACTDDPPFVCDTPAAARQLADAQRLADVATGVAIGGAVLVAAGAIVFATAPRDRERPVTVSPLAGGETLGIAVRGRF